MGPYLAVIADSFRAASHSRVLWMALVCVGLFLIALAPLGYRENAASRISALEIVSASQLTNRLQRGLADGVPSPTGQIAAALPRELQARIRGPNASSADPKNPSVSSDDYADALNRLIAGDDTWYDAEIWQDTLRRQELRQLDETATDQLSLAQLQRRSRLRLEAGLPGLIRPRGEKSITLTYAFWETPVEWPLSRSLFHQYLIGIFLPMILNGMLGYIGVVLGILVTAPTLPEMLQPGSLHLLLSKPISRWGLFLAKFVGGCAFMLLCVVPLLTGVWLILGIRFDLWLGGLFYCIPVYALLFMVYYSVSCLAALQWKSSIVAALVAIAFWVGCGALGMAGDLLQSLVAEPARIERLTVLPSSDSKRPHLFAALKNGQLNIWNFDRHDWMELELTDYRGEIVIGPVSLGNDRFAVARRRLSPVEALGSISLRGSDPVAVFSLTNPQAVRKGAKLPTGVFDLIDLRSRGILAVSNTGLYIAPADQLRQPGERSDGEGGFLSDLVQLVRPQEGAFQPILPSGFFLDQPLAVSATAGDDLIVYSGGFLMLWKPDPETDRWQMEARTELAGDATQAAKLGVSRQHIAIHRDGEPIRLFRLPDLEFHGELPIAQRKKVAQITGNPQSDTLVVRFGDQSMQQIQMSDSMQWKRLRSGAPKHKIEHVRFADTGELYIAHGIDSVVRIPTGEDQPAAQLRPSLSTWRMVHRYVSVPLRNIIPQTGELRAETIRAALSGSTTQEFGEGFFAERTRVKLNVKRPILTCLGFTLAMLLIGCGLFTYQDY